MAEDKIERRVIQKLILVAMLTAFTVVSITAQEKSGTTVRTRLQEWRLS